VKNPDSRMAKLRILLAAALDPMPDPGEAWCMDCALNGGRTQVLTATGYMTHVQLHADGDVVNIRTFEPLTLPLRSKR